MQPGGGARRSRAIAPDSAKASHSVIAAITGAARQHSDLLRNASSLMATTGVTSALGFAYWIVAARFFPQRSVGYASAALSAALLLGIVGMFGLGTLLIGELPRRSNRGGLATAALLASAGGSAVLALAFAVLAPLFSARFGQIIGNPALAALFTATAALIAVNAVFDQATIGILRGGVQLTRNLVFSLVKLALLPVFAFTLHNQFGVGIVVSYLIGLAVSLAAAAVQLRMSGVTILRRPDWGVLRGLGRLTLAHNWLNLAIAAPTTLTPVMVTVIVSPSANAAFYVATMLAGFVYIIPQHLSTVLFAEVSTNPQVIARKLRFTIRLSLLIGFPASVVLALGAHLALSMFGAGYARLATVPLILILAGYLPNIPKVHYIAVCRAGGKISRAATVLTAFAAFQMIAATAGGIADGLIGVSVVILVVSIIEGLATLPAVLLAISRGGRHRRPRVAAATAVAKASTPATGVAMGAQPPASPEGRAPAGAAQPARPVIPDRRAIVIANQSAGYVDSAQQEAGLAALLAIATTIGSTARALPTGLRR